MTEYCLKNEHCAIIIGAVGKAPLCLAIEPDPQVLDTAFLSRYNSSVVLVYHISHINI